jgi:hypothetical protein
LLLQRILDCALRAQSVGSAAAERWALNQLRQFAVKPENQLASLEDMLLAGIHHSVTRYQDLTKELIRFRPEYLVTVLVAESLLDQLGSDYCFRLEEPTRHAVRHLALYGSGVTKLPAEIRKFVGRKGLVDLFLYHQRLHHAVVVEFKNFDPPIDAVRKDLDRCAALLALEYPSRNLKACYVAFPSKGSYQAALDKEAAKFTALGILTSARSERMETYQDPEDGLPVYYGNVLGMRVPSRAV